MKFNIELPKKELDKLDKGKAFRIGLLNGVKDGMLFAESEAKKSFGRSGNLKVRTGLLRRSIKSSVKKTTKGVEGTLSDNVIYAAIHEFGGKAGKGLRSNIPARPFLRQAIENNIIQISRIIQKEIIKEVKRHAVK